MKGNASISGRGWSIGVLLVLFILVVIVTRIFNDSSQLESSQNSDSPPISIAEFNYFYIYNQSDSTFETTRLLGDFEPPGPPIHVLNPGQNYTYRVAIKNTDYRNAYVRYTSTSSNSVYIDITLRTYGSDRVILVTAIQGLTYSQNAEKLYIRNRYEP
ncbi:hypothetical protein M3223_14685 [Paenibacillus pasadenensis]|uniref:hypothetical protein n=1 Tax=Paenibacillus pasadenensis TaxID=217090 RepID=UPI0020411436|nr:hypothetical protein [Paenibacillus pasadenensis]MCM3748595.1 hypothetical protein [Paenibacillus pasadenensis]